MLRICLPACGARHLHAAWSAADICRPLCLVVTNYISFVSVLYTKTHSFRCSSSSRKVFWTFREPCYAPFIVRRTRSRVLLRKPVGRRFKGTINKKKLGTPKGVPSFFGTLHRFRYRYYSTNNEAFFQDYLKIFL